MVKSRIYSDDENERVAVSDILNHVLTTILKLLHPFMPFVTEEIYSKLIKFGSEDLIMAKWPTIREKYVFDEEENTVEKLKNLIVEIRNIRSKMNVHPSKKSKLIFIIDEASSSSDLLENIKESKDFLMKLGFGSEIVFAKNEDEIPQNAVSLIVDDLKLYIPFEELVDIEEEKKRLESEKSRLEAEVERGRKMLSNPGFVSKAPEKKINEEKEKLANYKNMLESVEKNLEKLVK